MSLVFDPKWALLTAGDDVIVRSNEGVCFYISLGLLAAHSSFFAGIASLPALNSVLTRDIIIDLASATTKCTQIALSLLDSMFTGLEPLNHFDDGEVAAVKLRHHFDDIDLPKVCSLFRELVVFADVYDCPELLERLRPCLSRSVWLQFALAAIQRNEDMAISIADVILNPRNNRSLIRAPVVIGKLLDEFVPGYDARLHYAISARRRAWSLFETAVRRMSKSIQHSGFGAECRKGQGCQAIRQYGSFRDFRRRAVDVAFDAVRSEWEPVDLLNTMCSAVRAEVGCYSCACRIQTIFHASFNTCYPTDDSIFRR